MNKGQQLTALITGVSSGIGFAIAKSLLAQGYLVFGSIRKAEDAEPLRSISADFIPLIFDVTDSSAIENAVKTVQSHLDNKGLNVLINNAGIGLSGPLMDQPMDQIRKTFEINVFGLLNVTRAFLPLLGAKENCTHPPGKVINIGSVSGSVTVPFAACYSASKHAIEALAQGFRRELAPFGIEVSTVEPGMIKTNLASTDSQNIADTTYDNSLYKTIWPTARKQMEALSEKGKSVDVVVDAVNKLIKSPKPKPRNPLDPSWYMGRILPDRVFDKMIFGALKIKELMVFKK